MVGYRSRAPVHYNNKLVYLIDKNSHSGVQSMYLFTEYNALKTKNILGKILHIISLYDTTSFKSC